jgi:RNA polymerase sigma-32 factor
MVKMGTTSGQKKLFFNLRKAKSRIGAYDEGDMRPEQVSKIATDLGVTETEVVSMNRRMSGGDASLNVVVGNDGESSTQWQDWLQDDKADQAGDYEKNDELSVRSEMLTEAMSVLNDREKDIILQRRLQDKPSTLEALSSTYEVSRERIRQIEVRAFEKLQGKMRNLAEDKGMMV